MKALKLLNYMFDEENFRAIRTEINEAIAELEAKDEHIKHLQDIYMKLDGKYLKLLEELKENK